MELDGGGLLPVALDNMGNIKFLFGLERDYWIDSVKGLCDFGGATEGDENRFEAACREAEEELVGFLGNSEELMKEATENLITTLTSTNYNSYVFAITYDEKLPLYFNRNFACIEKYNPDSFKNSGIYEKRQIIWISKDELITKKDEFRVFYANEFITQLLDKMYHIEKKLKCLYKIKYNNSIIKSSKSTLW
jgi:hypothetical protein|tara:strand:+ start:45 stop:620 length:576 start_codon:yes stop_codon:yes gene_type:complete